MPLLLRLLERGNALERRQAQRALQHAACWPPEAQRRGTLAGQNPPASVVGTALFATASAASGCLWLLVPETTDTTLGRAARSSIDRVWRLVSSDLAALARPELLTHPPSWNATLIARGAKDQAHLVDGESLGLSAAFAQISILSGLPTPHDVLAAAAVDDEGRLRPVDGLGTKLSMLQDWGLAVRRVVVSEDQVDDAKRAADANGLEILVEGHAHLGAAIDAVFPDRLDTLEERWLQHPELATKVARRLYQLALANRAALQSWRGFERTARRVASCLDDANGRVEAELAAAIACRHSGRPAPLCWPEEWFAQQPLQHRVQLLAHGLQAETDGAPGAGMLEQAERLLPPPQDRSAPHYELLGAMGRALAARHAWEEAARTLQAAVDAWLQLGRPEACSHPFCELLRVQGIRRDREGLAGSLTVLDEFRATANLPPISTGFLELAALRALVQTDQPREAIRRDAKAEVRYEAMPAHVRGARLRWLITANRALGEQPARRPEEIHEELRTLTEESATEMAFNLYLADLEAALVANNEAAIAGALAALRRVEANDVARLETLCGPDDLARNCLRFWRY